MQKKLIFLALTGLLCLSLAGCGQSGSTSPEGGSSPQAEQPAEETAGEDGGRTPEEDGADTEAPQYTDNFSIDTEAVTAFAEQIQAAVAEKDLEALADLASYPLYIGFSDERGCLISPKTHQMIFYFKKPLMISSSASFSVNPSVINLVNCSPAILPMAAS